MGFGTVIATGISIVLMLLMAYVLINGYLAAVDGTTSSLKIVADTKNEQLKTSITINNVTTDHNNITFEMYNQGSERIKDFSHMDVWLMFNRTVNGTGIATLYLPYDTAISGSANEWTVNGISPDIINPRVLDPGETAQCRAFVLDRPMPGQAWIKVSAPNGVTASTYFNVTM